MDKNNKTLVILIPGFAASEADTTCLPMQQAFIRSLKERNPQLNVIVLTFQYPYIRKNYDWYGIPVISFDGRNRGGLQRLFLRKAINTKLKKIKEDHQVIGLLSFWYGECAWVGKKFAAKNNLRHYCWIMGQDARTSNTYPSKLPPASNELIALSDFLLDEFQTNHGVSPSVVIPPGIASGKITLGSDRKRDIDILGAGSLIPLKQFQVFVNLVQEIKRKLPAIRSMLVGDGPEKNDLERLCNVSELDQNLTLTGELAHPELLARMRNTKVFLHPSSYEGFSGVCLEALSQGAHVISFCQPMKTNLPHWHIVETVAQMKEKAEEILSDASTDYSPSVPFPVEASADAILRLFMND